MLVHQKDEPQFRHFLHLSPMCSISTKQRYFMKFQANRMEHCKDIGILKSLAFIIVERLGKLLKIKLTSLLMSSRISRNLKLICLQGAKLLNIGSFRREKWPIKMKRGCFTPRSFRTFVQKTFPRQEPITRSLQLP